MMQIIPLAAIPNQQLTILLAGQNCQINVYQKNYGLFLDLLLNNAPLIVGALCLDRNRLVRDAYFGFAGDLAFIDNHGTSDPNYTGLGARFSLAYLAVSDLKAGEF
jgi:hypothetical protein